MTDYKILHDKAKKAHSEIFHPLADRFAFELPDNPHDAVRRPTALFLGNHSSGKSSFINHIVGRPIQKTGLAPTDDGFTIITHGDSEDSIDGQTVASHPDLAFHDLNRLGPAFISRLRLRAIPNPVLKDFNLIDSPGMIDAVDRSNTREYDFGRSIRIFAEQSDVILFFFDPDKPGTTAETIATLTNTLVGLEHKLLIVMNKVDLFTTMRDFARAYGTLCWNLSKAITTKDIPHIFTTYLPELADEKSQGEKAPIPLRDFDAAREEIVTEIKRTPTKRSDNLVSDLLQTARHLAVHARVCERIGQRYRTLLLQWYGSAAALLAITIVASWQLWDRLSTQQMAIAIALGAGATGLVAVLGYFQLRQFRTSLTRPAFLDPFFDQAFNDEITVGERSDLRGAWMGIRDQLARSLKIFSPAKFPFALLSRRYHRKLDEAIKVTIPKMRRDVGS